MKILVFLHGTLIMQQTGIGCSRQERVLQVEDGHASVLDYEAYVPINDAVNKLKGWASQGATILYLSSHQDKNDVVKDRKVLVRHGFPEGRVYFRKTSEDYQTVVQQITPDIIIEDDCESIGGQPEMTYPNLDESVKEKIKSVIVKEFSGIDHIPESIEELQNS